MISHHIPDDLLISYAAGTLDQAQMLALSSHISLCPHCKSNLMEAHAMGAACFEDIKPQPLNEGAVNSLLERLDAQERNIGSTTLENHHCDRLNSIPEIPNPVAHLFTEGLDDIKWKRIAPGAFRYDLSVEAESPSKLFLLKIEPKAKVPEHSHNGEEMTLILRGSYSDKFGTYKRGDIACHDPSVEHEPVIDSDVACISLVAVDAPLKFKGIFSRLLQPIIGI